MARDPGVEIRRIAAADARPLRLRILRAGQPPEAAVYPQDDDPATVHLGAFTPAGELVGIATLLPPEARVAGQAPYPEPGLRFRGMAVPEAWRGQGVGAALVQELRRLAREQGARELWANARLSAVGFYDRQGFKVVSTEFEIRGLGPHRVIADAP